jgi:signal transduction histidine kinase
MEGMPVRLLVIEDNPGDVDLIRAMLSEARETAYEIVAASRLAEGIDRLKQDKSIALVLLDLSLPDSTGMETLRKLLGEAEETPIVVLTVLDEETSGVEAVKCGAQDYLVKDRTDGPSLARAVRYAIERSKLEAELKQQRDSLADLARQRARLLELEKQARAQAEEANELKSKFLAMVSHELRTPLTSIKGFTSTLLARDVDWSEDDRREFMKILDEEADKLRDLVEQLLDVSTLQAGALTIHPQPLALAKIFDRAMAPLHVLAHNHDLHIHVPEFLPPVLADEQRITQVLANLVDNSRKYSPPKTRITVAAQARDPKMVQIQVADEGPGIPDEARIAAFEPFRKLHRHADGREKGAGLGLAICKGIIEAHGGSIWVADEVQRGTAICFTLPIAEGMTTGYDGNGAGTTASVDGRRG